MRSGNFQKTIMSFVPREYVDFRVVKGQSLCIARPLPQRWLNIGVWVFILTLLEFFRMYYLWPYTRAHLPQHFVLDCCSIHHNSDYLYNFTFNVYFYCLTMNSGWNPCLTTLQSGWHGMVSEWIFVKWMSQIDKIFTSPKYWVPLEAETMPSFFCMYITTKHRGVIF